MRTTRKKRVSRRTLCLVGCSNTSTKQYYGTTNNTFPKAEEEGNAAAGPAPSPSVVTSKKVSKKASRTRKSKDKKGFPLYRCLPVELKFRVWELLDVPRGHYVNIAISTPWKSPLRRHDTKFVLVLPTESIFRKMSGYHEINKAKLVDRISLEVLSKMSAAVPAGSEVKIHNRMTKTTGATPYCILDGSRDLLILDTCDYQHNRAGYPAPCNRYFDPPPGIISQMCWVDSEPSIANAARIGLVYHQTYDSQSGAIASHMKTMAAARTSRNSRIGYSCTRHHASAVCCPCCIEKALSKVFGKFQAKRARSNLLPTDPWPGTKPDPPTIYLIVDNRTEVRIGKFSLSLSLSPFSIFPSSSPPQYLLN